MTVLAEVFQDLATESAELDDIVAGLDGAGWRTPTPAVGWSVAHQIAHLAWTDEAAHLAVTDPTAFTTLLTEAGTQLYTLVDDEAAAGAAAEPAALLARWRASRAALADALATVGPGDRITWFGPPMRPASMATARLMETWAHGLDVADALDVEPAPTGRLRHIAHLGVRTLPFAYLVNDRDVPDTELRVELTAPDGSCWIWGPETATERVTGPALDFCLLVTRRRHRADLTLRAAGPVADEWLDIAQAFAGPPGTGRPPSP